jgi:transmembrane sensor
MKQPASALLQEAAEWFVRLRDPEEDIESLRAAHRVWRNAAPENEAAWREIEASFAISRQVHATAIVGGRPQQAWRPLALAASTMLIACMAAFAWWQVSGTRYRTEAGEMRAIELADGSTVHLNGATSLRVRLGDAERRVDLIAGEALFTVAKDAARPFRVHAADRIVEAVGTEFDVDLRPGGADVAVSEGAVVVKADDAGAPAETAGPVRVASGQAISYAAGQTPNAVRPVAAARIASWRRGLLTYDGVPFATVVADLDRYFAGVHAVDTPQLAQMPVTLSFRLADRAQTIHMIEQLLPVRAEQRGDRVRFVPVRK